MTRNQKRNLLITLTIIFVLIGTICSYWAIIGFNPFDWIANNSNMFILAFTLGFCALLIILGYWLGHRKRL